MAIFFPPQVVVFPAAFVDHVGCDEAAGSSLSSQPDKEIRHRRRVAARDENVEQKLPRRALGTERALRWLSFHC